MTSPPDPERLPETETHRLLAALAALPGVVIGDSDTAPVAVRAALDENYRVFGWYATVPAPVWDDASAREVVQPVQRPHVAWRGPHGWSACAITLEPTDIIWWDLDWWEKIHRLGRALTYDLWGPSPDLPELIITGVHDTASDENGNTWIRFGVSEQRAMLWGLAGLMSVEERAQVATLLALTDPDVLADHAHLFPAALDAAQPSPLTDWDRDVLEYQSDGAIVAGHLTRIGAPS